VFFHVGTIAKTHHFPIIFPPESAMAAMARRVIGVHGQFRLGLLQVRFNRGDVMAHGGEDLIDLHGNSIAPLFCHESTNKLGDMKPYHTNKAGKIMEHEEFK
jgi:hypothetical protein